jgi:serine/threonine protein kinase/formylglycine-generating enzyme required for sulfatase activity
VEQRQPGRAFCPECGQKYAVPEDELRRRAGLRFRATCRACSTPFAVLWDGTGLVTEREEVLQTDDTDERDVLPQGARVGKYEIEDPVSSGGSSTVYQAFELGANRQVALKVLHQEPDSDYGIRFQREVEVQGNLKHPNLMPIFDQGVVDGKPYYSMELLHKPITFDSLVRLFRSNRLGYNPALRTLNSIPALLRQMILPVCRAIGFANANGIVHRDLKPGNILIDGRTLRVYVIDFGICHVSKSTGTRLVLRADDATRDEAREAAKSKAFAMGTLRYMPPEQAQGEVSPQGDVWALGALMHFLLSGDAPIAAAVDLQKVSIEKRVANLEKIAASCRAAGDEDDAVFYEQRLEELRSGSLRSAQDMLRDAIGGNYSSLPRDVDPGLAAIVRRAMAIDPTHRYTDAAALAADVDRWLSGRPVRAYSARLGGARASGYRTRLFLLRHKTTVMTLAALTVVATLGAAIWSFRQSAKEEKALHAWLNEAKASDDPSVQEDRLTRYLALRPGDSEAESRLALARQYKPVLKRIQEAENVQLKVSELRRTGQIEMADQLAADMAAVLSGSVLPDLLALPEDHAGRRRESEVRGLTNYLRGRRSVNLLGVPADAAVLLLFPVARGSKSIDWSKPREIGVGTPKTALPLDSGSYVFIIRRDERSIYIPVEIGNASAPSIVVGCEMNPTDVPDGMVWIAGGEDIEFGDIRFQAETHRETLQAFLIDETEVTCSQYARYLNRLPGPQREAAAPRRVVDGQPDRVDPLWNRRVDGSWSHPVEMGQFPVVGVSVVDAERYAKWAGKRLPTRDEWERAARGLDGRDFPFGDLLDRDACNAATGMPGAVRSSPRDRSPFGVWDMGGNVAEWTASHGSVGQIKGGSFDLPRYRVAAAASGRRDADRPYPDVGFRCVKDLKR